METVLQNRLHDCSRIVLAKDAREQGSIIFKAGVGSRKATSIEIAVAGGRKGQRLCPSVIQNVLLHRLLDCSRIVLAKDAREQGGIIFKAGVGSRKAAKSKE